MATARPFAYNTGTTIDGTEQVGDLSIGTPTSGFTNNPQFWNGPDEELGYVIVYPVSGGTHPTPISEVTAYLGFLGTKNMVDPLSEGSFVELTNNSFSQSFTNGNEASTWLTENGYWNSWTSGATTDGWLFYYQEGPLSVGPPENDGNTLFMYVPAFEGTYNPNYTGGTLELFFNENDSAGTSYLTQFQELDTNGGTLTISQSSNTVIYSGSPAQYNIELVAGFLVLQVTNESQMIQSASTAFVSGVTINVVVS